jgi:hypothetical protein
MVRPADIPIIPARASDAVLPEKCGGEWRILEAVNK